MSSIDGIYLIDELNTFLIVSIVGQTRIELGYGRTKNVNDLRMHVVGCMSNELNDKNYE